MTSAISAEDPTRLHPRHPILLASSSSPDPASFDESDAFSCIWRRTARNIPLVNHTLAALRFFFREKKKVEKTKEGKKKRGSRSGAPDIIEHRRSPEPRSWPFVLSPGMWLGCWMPRGLKYKATLSGLMAGSAPAE